MKNFDRFFFFFFEILKIITRYIFPIRLPNPKSSSFILICYSSIYSLSVFSMKANRWRYLNIWISILIFKGVRPSSAKIFILLITAHKLIHKTFQFYWWNYPSLKKLLSFHGQIKLTSLSSQEVLNKLRLLFFYLCKIFLPCLSIYQSVIVFSLME